jgi:hypothetical protein
LRRVPNVGPELAASIAHWQDTVDLAGEMKRIEQFGCKIVIQSDENYPALLKQIYDPPIVLYVKGELLSKDKNAVSICRLAHDDALRCGNGAQDRVSTGIHRHHGRQRRRARDRHSGASGRSGGKWTDRLRPGHGNQHYILKLHKKWPTAILGKHFSAQKHKPRVYKCFYKNVLYIGG